MPNTDAKEGRPAAAQQIALALLLVGIALIGGSLVWPSLSSGKSAWSEEQARQYQAASANLHGLSHKYEDSLVGKESPELPAELKQAQTEYGQLREQLDAVRSQPARIAFICRVLGIVSTVIGALLYLTSGRPD